MADTQQANTYVCTAGLMSQPAFLHSAECSGSSDHAGAMLQLLQATPRLLEQPLAADGMTPVFHAASVGHANCVQLLLHARPDVERFCRLGDLITTAVSSDCVETVKVLLGEGVGPNGRGAVPCEPLALAVHNNNTLMVRLLLQHGALVQDTYSSTAHGGGPPALTRVPIVYAMFHENYEILKLLLLHGADMYIHKIITPNLKNLFCLNFVPEKMKCCYGPDSLSKRMEIVELLHAFGASFEEHHVDWGVSSRYPAMLLCPLLVPHPQLSDAQLHLLRCHLRAVLSEPLSLQALCRLAIRKALGSRLVQPPLLLPSYLLRFLEMA